MPKIVCLAPTVLIRSDSLANKVKQPYGILAILSHAVIVAFEVDKRPQIFITRSNQHIQKINRDFDETLNHFGPMGFSGNQEQNESYTFKVVLFYTDKA